MKMLFTSPDRIEVGRLKALLDDAGIACELRNDSMSAIYPVAEFNAELWVLNDADTDRACELRDAFRNSSPVRTEPWTCPQCGERLEAQFTTCWKCETIRADAK